MIIIPLVLSPSQFWNGSMWLAMYMSHDRVLQCTLCISVIFRGAVFIGIKRLESHLIIELLQTWGDGRKIKKQVTASLDIWAGFHWLLFLSVSIRTRHNELWDHTRLHGNVYHHFFLLWTPQTPNSHKTRKWHVIAQHHNLVSGQWSFYRSVMRSESDDDLIHMYSRRPEAAAAPVQWWLCRSCLHRTNTSTRFTFSCFLWKHRPLGWMSSESEISYWCLGGDWGNSLQPRIEKYTDQEN